MTGNVTGNPTGDVLSSGGNVVLDSGTDGTDATFTGDVTGDVTGNLTGNVTGDLTGDVYATGGQKVLESGTNGTDATFTGDVTGDITGNVMVTLQVMFTRLVDKKFLKLVLMVLMLVKVMLLL